LIKVDDRSLPAIPQSFLGLSHEWPFVEEMSTQPKSVLAEAGGIYIRGSPGSWDNKRSYVPCISVSDSTPVRGAWQARQYIT
jgi:hypothetical protein